MCTNFENSLKRKTAFKASKKGKAKEQKSSESLEEDSEDEVAHLVRKLKRGSSKYKGKLPLKCFSCGKIGHFASKCPYEKEEDSDDERSSKFKNSKSEEENQNDEILFMAVEDTQEEEEYFDEVEVDLEQELISALNEIKKLKKKNQNLKQLLQEENNKFSKKSMALEAAKKMVADLIIQSEEARKTKEELRKQIKEKELNCEKLD
ncbi:uncharacterized protein LOC131062296 [Cryptomeria japonica]|uniref:uncharacterized protein LOC131062296 n=1 Tax=Cryptomeria japonica TaxID=3369 RepID=UPI0027DA6429|nr:uncharacterized protein LOC131062296 [Cryptomeria japonica]